MRPFADIHCHPTLHPFAFYDSGRKIKNSQWRENRPKERQRDDRYPEYFQSNMPALARGNVRLIVVSLYPLEQPWFDPTLTGTGNVTDFMASKLTVHVPVKYLNKIQSRGYNYYKKISDYNSGRVETERIPIVASHCGYSGYHTLSDAIIVPDTEPSKYKRSETFNPWSNNLCDEEIVNIFQSGGIIGINLDQRILSGMDVIEDSNDFSNREIFKNQEPVVKFWTEQIARNILGMVKAVVDSDDIDDAEKVKAWDIISIGSDFDGMINPIDSFITADEFKDMRRALEKYMPQVDGYDACSMGLLIGDILDKIMYDNVTNFVIRNYN